MLFLQALFANPSVLIFVSTSFAVKMNDRIDEARKSEKHVGHQFGPFQERRPLSQAVPSRSPFNLIFQAAGLPGGDVPAGIGFIPGEEIDLCS